MRVSDKNPTEVSIVVKGDRPNTAIRGWVSEAARKQSRTLVQKQDPTHRSEKTQYILQGVGQQPTDNQPITSTIHTMSTEDTINTETPTTVDSGETDHNATESSSSNNANNEMHELLEQLRSQAEANVKYKMQQDANEKKMTELATRVQKYEQVGSDRRKRALDGAVKDWVGKMVETHAKELGPYENQLKELIGAMKNHEDAEPMVQMLSCAASASAESTSKLNKAYQDLKDANQQAKRFKSQYEASQKPAFAQQSDRFKAPAPPTKAADAPPAAPSDAYVRMFSRKSTSGQQGGGGLAAANPSMWNAIRSRAANLPTGSAKNPAFDTTMFSEDMQRRFPER